VPHTNAIHVSAPNPGRTLHHSFSLAPQGRSTHGRVSPFGQPDHLDLSIVSGDRRDAPDEGGQTEHEKRGAGPGQPERLALDARLQHRKVGIVWRVEDGDGLAGGIAGGDLALGPAAAAGGLAESADVVVVPLAVDVLVIDETGAR
jgi:hypothetical protein